MQLCSEIINGHSIKLTSGEDLPVSELLDSRAGTSQCSSGNLITAGHIKELFCISMLQEFQVNEHEYLLVVDRKPFQPTPCFMLIHSLSQQAPIFVEHSIVSIYDKASAAGILRSALLHSHCIRLQDTFFDPPPLHVR